VYALFPIGKLLIVPVADVSICDAPLRSNPPPNFPLAVYWAPLFAVSGVPPVVLCPMALALSKFQYATSPVVTSAVGVAEAAEYEKPTNVAVHTREKTGIRRRMQCATESLLDGIT
jgi:hypothetical protein